ncbi:MAG: peroxiredoxin [Verrucomicrobiota bacterium]
MIKCLCRVVSSILLIGSAANAEPLAVGAELPDIKAVDQDSKEVSLADYRKSPFVLVYFYPKADTPGCTAQACSLRDAYSELTNDGVTVFGVSTDSPAQQKSFQKTYRLQFDLLADEDGSVAKAFGVPLRGKFAARQAFLFEKGKLIWMDQKASTKQQADDVKKVLANLGADKEKPASDAG